MVKTKDSILLQHQNRVEEQMRVIQDIKTRLNNTSLSRLGIFLFEIAIIALVIYLGFNVFFDILLVLPVFAFMFLVKKQSKLQQDVAYNEQLYWVFENEVHALAERRNGYADGSVYSDEEHPYTSDLDIFGGGSLYASLNRCNTLEGMDLLAKSLSSPNTYKTIRQRQEAIREISDHIDKTYDFRASLHGHAPNQLAVLKKKLSSQLPEELAFTHNKALRAYTAIAPLISVGSLVLGIIFGGQVWDLFVVVTLFNMALTYFYLKRINGVHEGFSGSSAFLNSFSEAVSWTESISWKSNYILDFFSQHTEDNRVSKQIKQLSALIRSFDARLNMLLGSILNIFLLWDFRCAIGLDKWYQSASKDLVQGLSRISQFEELISFATLKHNQPDWSFPDISPEFKFQTRHMGHPLIPEDKRIYNDYTLLAAPTVDIVTGSNMAGKSTFLRTVGINMVLAYAGAVVCAEQLQLSIFSVITYMRIKDSLNDQTSTFKAELNRLKMILESIERIPDSFVLIDEMLRGTNSKDKYLGSKVFIEKLLSKHVPALFATHDLQLSEMVEDHPAELRNYHFDIQLSGSEMNFDYQLKQGACKTFNAAILLKQIGLSLDNEA